MQNEIETDTGEHILTTAARWQEGGARIALAVVIATWGSSPRQAGSIMAIADDGRIAGSVSGGCVEGTVMETARALLAKDGGGSEECSFGVEDETAWRVGLPCGGSIRVFICAREAIAKDLLRHAASTITKREAVAIDCRLDSGKMDIAAHPPAIADANSIDGDTFRLFIPPAFRLFIIGAGHISQHLAPMARRAGYAVTVIDPRTAFATTERFPATTLIADWPQDYFATITLDAQSAVVTLTHDAKIDDAALRVALRHPLFYIASLGSNRTHEKRKARLMEAGFDEAAIARIHAPAGLNIGAANPAEIAAAILAQMIAVRRKGDSADADKGKGAK